MRRKSFGTLFAVLGLLFWDMMVAGDATAAATAAGTVVAVSGPCTANGRTLRSGDKVQVGGTVQVPAGGFLKLQMVDGSSLLISPDSSMSVTSYDIGAASRNAKLLLEHGLLRAVVTPAGENSSFAVSTAAGTASVRSESADWFIGAEPDAARVGVLAGRVDFASAATSRSVSIPAHWGTRLEAGRDPMLPRVWSQMEFNAVIRLTECCHGVGAATDSDRPASLEDGPNRP